MTKKKEGKKKVAKKAPKEKAEKPEPKPSEFNQGLAKITADLTKEFGKGAVGFYGAEGVETAEYGVVSTGSLVLDRELGCGGIPRGRVIEIFGPEAAGKTWLTTKILAQFQADNLEKKVAFIDAEHTLEPDWAQNGPAKLDMSQTLFCQPQSAEEALTIALALVKSGEVSALAIDSVSSLTPQAELDGDMGQSHPGLHARLMGQAMRKLVAALKKTQCTLILINQLRMKIGVMFGSPETTSGGNSIKFNASMRFRVSKTKTIGPKDNAIGWKMCVRIKKNKCGVPFKEPELDILHDRGFWLEKEIIQLGSQLGVVQKVGTYYSLADDFGFKDYNGMKLGQGVEAAAALIEVQPKLVKILRRRILAA